MYVMREYLECDVLFLLQCVCAPGLRHEIEVSEHGDLYYSRESEDFCGLALAWEYVGHYLTKWYVKAALGFSFPVLIIDE